MLTCRTHGSETSLLIPSCRVSARLRNIHVVSAGDRNKTCPVFCMKFSTRLPVAQGMINAEWLGYRLLSTAAKSDSGLLESSSLISASYLNRNFTLGQVFISK